LIVASKSLERERRFAMKPSIIAVTVLAGMTWIGNAEGADLSKEYTDCMKSAPTTVKMVLCGNQEIARQEAQLTTAWHSAYSEMKAKMPPADAKMLLDEQRAWVIFKDKACRES
jgi:uncharacterized protein YecT (DUF1311 family)